MYLESDKHGDLGYRRKFNALHCHIVETYGDGQDTCDPIPLSKGNIQDILDRLKKIKKDNTLAELLLPACDGFFFGSTDYDSYYFENVKDSIKIFTKVLKDYSNDRGGIHYQASW